MTHRTHQEYQPLQSRCAVGFFQQKVETHSNGVGREIMSEISKRTVHSLSFITDGKWMPLRTEDTEKDNEHGRACAEEMLNFIHETGNPAIFGSIVRAITESQIYSAVEIGFCSKIGIFIAVNVEG